MSRYIEYDQPNQDHPEGTTEAFIQWKGSDMCLDFHCRCGFHGHWHGMFGYVFRCPDCKTLWEAPAYITYRESRRPLEYGCIVEPDDEGWFET